MDAFKTDRAVYSPNDFVVWLNNDMLVISPKFQRRSVWPTAARSFFIDTLLRGMPVPPLYLRMRQNDTKTKMIREVIDGQQRVRAVLEYVEGKFRLSTNKKNRMPWDGKKFEQLSSDDQERIMSFSFSSEVFKGITDQQVLEVFCRMNMYSIPLNQQELRNGKFFGPFKQTCYDLALKYLEFWRHHRIFSEQNIARMLEVELVSELLIAGNAGMQDKKITVNDYYEKWEQSYPDQSRDEKRFREVLSTLSDTFENGDLAGSAFRRPPLFYTLYCVIWHHMFGLPGVQRSSPRKHLTADQRESLREAVIRLSDMIAEDKDPSGHLPQKFTAFVTAALRSTDKITQRKIRFDTLYGEAF